MPMKLSSKLYILPSSENSITTLDSSSIKTYYRELSVKPDNLGQSHMIIANGE